MMRTAVANPSFAPSMKASYTFTFLRIPASMNTTMMSISRMFATDVLTTFICVLSICENPHIMAAIAADIPPSVRSMVRLIRLMRWYIEVTTIPASVEEKVASSKGTKMSVGCAAPV